MVQSAVRFCLFALDKLLRIGYNRVMDAMIVDMDGTLADVRGIRHHIVPPDPMPKGWYKDFHAFHRESVNAPLNHSVRDQVLRAHMMGTKILIVTARKHMYRHHTAMFLAIHDIPSDALYMRGDKDGRPDYEVKKDILWKIRKRGYNVIHAIDDNDNVIKLWKSEGIPVTEIEGFGF
jgi:mRNA-degrading endonuclease RelE of RelBE toxin-antitoxin system